MRTDNYRAAIIGGGITGGALALDLALRGFHVTLIERGELLSGITSLHHGVLHSGARYAVTDPIVARQCMEEIRILRRIAPESVRHEPAFYLAVYDEDVAYSELFIESCMKCKIPVQKIDIPRALNLEPKINPLARMALEVPDISVDPCELPMRYINTATHNGASIKRFCVVTDLLVREKNVCGLIFQDASKKNHRINSDVVINAAGPWAKSICDLAGLNIPINTVAGLLYSIPERVTNRVISRLNFPGDADSIVPRGSITIIGSNSWHSDEALPSFIPNEYVEYIRTRASDLIPVCKNIPPARVWAASRSLYGREPASSGRALSRNFKIIDHKRDGINGFFTIVGGKATTARRVAEVMGNIVCQRIGLTERCRTRKTPLLPPRPQ